MTSMYPSNLSSMRTVSEVNDITNRISMSLLGNNTFALRVDEDVLYKDPNGRGRIFIQASYEAPCTKSGQPERWKGRKFYLSDYMLEQEIIFTAYLAFKQAIEHETMEGFKIDGIILVNPHVNYNRLLEISQDEVKREALNELL